jgi:predicted transglutaminase-like cysteine proteinase
MMMIQWARDIALRKIASVLMALSFLTYAPTKLVAGDEPFGLEKVVAPESHNTVAEWRKLMANVASAKRELEKCLAEADRCSASQKRFVALIKEAKGRHGRAKIELVNERINGQVRYAPDQAQWGTADKWTLPVTASEDGSVNRGAGDCEDYALAKYVALHQAGVPDESLRMVLVHDKAVREDHAVLAVRDDSKWLILDNRWNKPIEDTELTRFTPLFVVEKTGVKRLAKAFRLNDRMTIAPSPVPASKAGSQQ